MNGRDFILILAAGMPRSASTWLYNATRLLLLDKLDDEFSCGWVGDLNRITHKKNMLIKIHDFDPKLVDQSKYIIYSFRDIRDVLASYLRIFGDEPCMKQADYLIYQYEKWIEVAGFVMKYETMMSNKENIIIQLAKYLGIEQYQPEEVIKNIEKLSYENQGEKNEEHHYINLYHKGHKTDGRHGSWIGLIDPELIRQIEYKYKVWFVKCGYPINVHSASNLVNSSNYF